MKKEINVVVPSLWTDEGSGCAEELQDVAARHVGSFPVARSKPVKLLVRLVRELQEELLCTAEIGDEVASTRHEYDFGFKSPDYLLLKASRRRTEI